MQAARDGLGGREQAGTVGGDDSSCCHLITPNSPVTFKGGPPAGEQALKA